MNDEIILEIQLNEIQHESATDWSNAQINEIYLAHRKLFVFEWTSGILMYKKEDLLGKQVIAVTNFPPKQIANFVSECLVLGVVLENGDVVMLEPERKVPNGYRIS